MLMSMPRFKKLLRHGKQPPSNLLVRKQLLTTFESLDERRICFTISTAAIDRAQDSIAVEGWDLTAYRQNPVVLWSHNADMLPIGRATEIDIVGGALKATVQFVDQSVPCIGDHAEAVLQLLRGGFLNATSVGFRPIEFSFTEDPERGGDDWFGGIDFKSQELLEFSIVTVPCNPEALIDPGQQDFDPSDSTGPNQSVSPQSDGLEEERAALAATLKRARQQRVRTLRQLISGG
jgi:HK97 family phage prohead protease